MIFRIGLISIAFLLLLPYVANADNALGFLYSRNKITIVRNQPPPDLPWLKGPPSNPAIAFDIEIRDASSVYNPKIPGGQTGWFNLSSPAENQGVMIVFNEPVVYPIVSSSEYALLDVLLVDNDGKIINLIPELKLSELDHNIIPEKPILAFLFLQGGIAKKLSIRPGDRVDSNVFKKSRVIINTDKVRVPNGDITAPVTAKTPELMVPDASEITRKK